MSAGLHVATVAAGTWAVSDSRTRLTFEVGHLHRPVTGSMALAWGEVEVDASGAPVRARAEIDLGSVDTGNARRDADLRKPRFLDIDRHPVMRWSADRFTGGAGVGWTAYGVLHVRGTSTPLAVSGTPEAGPDGEGVRVRALAVLDRTSVGIRAPRVLVGRTVEIAIDAWLTPPRQARR